MTPGELFSLLIRQLRNAVMSGKSQQILPVFGRISNKWILINNNYAVCIKEHFCFFLWVKIADPGSQFDT